MSDHDHGVKRKIEVEDFRPTQTLPVFNYMLDLCRKKTPKFRFSSAILLSDLGARRCHHQPGSGPSLRTEPAKILFQRA